MKQPWLLRGALFFLFLVMDTVSGTDTSPSSTSIESELTLLSQSIEQLRQDKMENKERVKNLELRITHLEAVCSNQTNLEATVLLLGGFSWAHEKSVTVLGDTECKVSDIPLHRCFLGFHVVTTSSTE